MVQNDDGMAPDSKEARAKVPAPTKPGKTGINLKAANRGQDDGLQADERNFASELALEKAAKNAKDVLLQETAHILADETALLKTDTRMANRTMPYMPVLKVGN
jgi:carboxyl-terminal processing protease